MQVSGTYGSRNRGFGFFAHICAKMANILSPPSCAILNNIDPGSVDPGNDI